MPLLTIGFPTYNRAWYLKRAIETIISTDVFQKTQDVEIVVSDNCSTDETEKICREFTTRYPDKIFYHKQNTPLFPDDNMLKPMDYAHGEFVKINNDIYGFKPGILDKTVALLKAHRSADFIFFLNNSLPTKQELIRCFNYDEIAETVSFYSTWIGCFCMKRATFKAMKDPLRYSKLRFPTPDILARLVEEGKEVLVYNEPQFEQNLPPKKGARYNCAETFGRDYLFVLAQHLNKPNGISKKMWNQERRKILHHANYYYFDLVDSFTFQKTGYLKYMLTYYKFDPIFWLHYAKYLFLSHFLISKKGPNHEYNHFNFLCFRWDSKRNIKKLWRKRNKHNRTTLMSEDFLNHIHVKADTTGALCVSGNPASRNQLFIGNNCHISDGVKFILSLPGKRQLLLNRQGFDGEISFENITLQDDVWIGDNVLIYPGVTIGQGSIIKPGAVVTEDIPPYAIVSGHPALVESYRFSQDLIKKLCTLDFDKNLSHIQEYASRIITSENIDTVCEDKSDDK